MRFAILEMTEAHPLESPAITSDAHSAVLFKAYVQFRILLFGARFVRIAEPRMAFDSIPTGELEIRMDGLLIELPPERISFVGIRSYLESLALQQQRILCSVTLDGTPVNLAAPVPFSQNFARVEAETMSLNEVPEQLLKAALQQTATVRARVQSAVELVLINSTEHARELWWEIAAGMKEPLLTLSLLPDNFGGTAHGSASVLQLRKWQLQQLGCVIRDVDHAGRFADPILLSEALETRALPWLDGLRASLNLWHETVISRTPSTCPN